MANPARTQIPDTLLYQRDFVRWAEEQGRKLRAHDTREIDWENVAEEIESLGRSDRFEIESRMEVLVLHLLKWRLQPKARSNSWRATIEEQRVRIGRRIAESPSLKRYPAEVLDDAYRIARPRAADEMGYVLEDLPKTCPFTIQQIFDRDFLPG